MNRQIIRAAAVIVVLMAVSGCVMLQPAPQVPPNLDTYDGLAAAINDRSDILILDVRTPEETETGMIPGAVNVPIDQIDDTFSRRDRNQVVVVYCASGGRSRLAYQTLSEKGFDYVFDFGSIHNWQGELVTDCDCPD